MEKYFEKVNVTVNWRYRVSKRFVYIISQPRQLKVKGIDRNPMLKEPPMESILKS